MVPTLVSHLLDRLAVRRQRGQSAAEYLGVIILVVAVIAALSQIGIGEDIAKFLKDTIGEISGE